MFSRDEDLVREGFIFNKSTLKRNKYIASVCHEGTAGVLRVCCNLYRMRPEKQTIIFAILVKSGFESVENLPRTAVGFVGFSSKAYQDLPPQLRLSATSNGEQRVRVRVPNAQGLHRTTQFIMQERMFASNLSHRDRKPKYISKF